VLHDFLKAIVGMLNRNGGTIFVGILEGEKFDDNEYRKLEALGAIRKQNRIFLGIAFELKAVGKTKDEHMRHIAQTLRSRISNDVTSFVSIDVTSAFGVELYRVTIQPYPYVEGVCLDGKEYFVRENNETLSKSAPEFIKIRLLSGKGLTRITETPTPVAE
jgi:predicted HTH transcriptional regulator